MRYNKHNMQDQDNYSVKTYPKKQKNYNCLFDIPMTEYELQKERQRQKRAMDKKRPKNRKYKHEEY